MSSINILQLNIRGILSSNNQQLKTQYLNRIITSRRIDIILLQEWSANKRFKISDDNNNKTTFPTKLFPDFKAHFHSTECAVLYKKDLCITPLPEQKDYLLSEHRKNFHICGVILHSGKLDYGIYSVYRPQTANATQIFEYQFESDHTIIGGDFNIHHTLWGSNESTKQGTNFVDTLIHSNLNIVNNQNPTRLDPRNGTLTHTGESLIIHTDY